MQPLQELESFLVVGTCRFHLPYFACAACDCKVCYRSQRSLALLIRLNLAGGLNRFVQFFQQSIEFVLRLLIEGPRLGLTTTIGRK
jgi:hypothetical protein